MGGLCSKVSAVDKSPSESTLHADGLRDHWPESHMKGKSDSMAPVGEVTEKRFPDDSFTFSGSIPNGGTESREPQLSNSVSEKSAGMTKANAKTGTKVSEMSSRLGRAGTVGFGKAVDVLDTLGSSMTSLHLSSGFVSGVAAKGNKISILAFEVANTIVKGANLMQSLSEENVKHLKEVVIPSEGVQYLISKDTDALLRIAATDKREELKIFSGEIVRFGNRCKDPQWHNLDRYFDRQGSELAPQNHLKETVETVMLQLMTLVQNTAELYHELHALDRFEQDYRRKQQEDENIAAVQKAGRIDHWLDTVGETSISNMLDGDNNPNRCYASNSSRRERREDRGSDGNGNSLQQDHPSLDGDHTCGGASVVAPLRLSLVGRSVMV